MAERIIIHRAVIALLKLAVLTAALAQQGCGVGGRSTDNDGQTQTIMVFAAASTADAVRVVAAAYEAINPSIRVRINAASSSTLSRQIEAGANADMFLSANARWVDDLLEQSLLNGESRTDLLGNNLVLIEHKTSARTQSNSEQQHSAAALLERFVEAGTNDRLAVGDPDHVPAGMYARQSLEAMGVWEAMRPKLAPAASVRAALEFVASGQTPLGIVYATDVRATERVRVVADIDPSSHDPIVYPLVLTVEASDAAGLFLDYIRSDPDAADVFRGHGFRVGPFDS